MVLLTFRAKADSVLRARELGSKEVGTALDVQDGIVPVSLLTAKVVTTMEGELPTVGGPTGRKFVQVATEVVTADHLALLVALSGSLDARDIGSAAIKIRKTLDLTLNEVAGAFGRSRAWCREVIGLSRIHPVISKEIDASSHWPTFENLVHVSRATTIEDQRERWAAIQRGDKRAARRIRREEFHLSRGLKHLDFAEKEIGRFAETTLVRPINVQEQEQIRLIKRKINHINRLIPADQPVGRPTGGEDSR